MRPVLAFLFPFWFSILLAQELLDTPAPEPAAPVETEQSKKIEALFLNLQLRQSLEAQIDDLRQKLSDTAADRTEFEITEITTDLKEQQAELELLEEKFSTVSSGLKVDELLEGQKTEVNIRAEIEEIFKPLVQEFRDITAAPREAEELRSTIVELQRKIEIIEKAQGSLAEISPPAGREALKAALDEENEKLTELKTVHISDLRAAEAQLADQVRDSLGFVESMSNLVQDFFKTRGAHLILAILGAFAVVILIRVLYRILMKISPKAIHKGETFAGRLVHLCYTIAAVLGGLITFLVILYLANDWLLLALFLLLLFGIIWAGKHTIPEFFEQGKMMLNLGPVRHHERLIYEGIPWEVQRVNFYTTLINPELEGGKIRLPMRDLMSLHSRPNVEGELWFPSRDDDWVELSDGTFGKVIQQTPDYVHLVKLGGTRKVIPTPDYLALHPENLSKNFRIKVVFGIDYDHQAISTNRVPQIFEADIQRALLEKVEKDQLHSVKVYFTAANASSLDYRIIVDLTGDIAPRRQALTDLVNATCVETCNREGWVIPFTQITVHEAATAALPETEAKPSRLP